MKILITEEKSEKMLDKLEKIKEFACEMCEWIEEGTESMDMRRGTHDDDDDDDYGMRRGGYGTRRRERNKDDRMYFRGGRY